MKKIAHFTTFLLLACFFIVACKDEDTLPPNESVPDITSFSPNSGPVNTTVWIVGKNFGSTPTVKIGDEEMDISSASNTEIFASIPANAQTGKISVTSNGKTDTAGTFTVTSSETVPEAIELADNYLEMHTLETAEFPEITNWEQFPDGSSIQIESNNPDIVDINQDGDLVAFQSGGAEIEVTITYGNAVLSATINVDVNPSIFVGGYIQKDNDEYEYGVATVWTNGVAHELTDTSSYDTYIAVEGPNLYATHVEYSLDDTRPIKVYKNNTFYGTVGNVDENHRFPKAIQVKGDKIYICGTERTDGTSYAKYWENGVENVLSNINKSASADDMMILDGMVYIAGDEQNEENTFVAKYWKNGTAFDVTDGTNRAHAHSIYVDGNTVYTAGYENNQALKDVAKSWMNGSLLYEVGNGINSSVIESIVVDGANTYMAGIDWGNNMAKLWINGEAEINLTTESKDSEAYDMVLNNGVLYIAGSRQSEENNEIWVAVVWVVNGSGEIIEEIILPSDTSAYANSIVVK